MLSPVQRRQKAMFLAYVLRMEYGAKQRSISEVLGVSEPTISLWLKEMRLRAEILQLNQELQEARQLAQNLIGQGSISIENQPYAILDQ